MWKQETLSVLVRFPFFLLFAGVAVVTEFRGSGKVQLVVLIVLQGPCTFPHPL